MNTVPVCLDGYHHRPGFKVKSAWIICVRILVCML